MLVTYVDRCAVCSCSSLRDEGGRRPVPGLTSCASAGSGGCPCHQTVPAAMVRSARAARAGTSNDALRFRLFRRARRVAQTTGQPAARWT